MSRNWLARPASIRLWGAAVTLAMNGHTSPRFGSSGAEAGLLGGGREGGATSLCRGEGGQAGASAMDGAFGCGRIRGRKHGLGKRPSASS
jgi:hypothetical protein